MFPTSQAQYECLSRSGYLAEVLDDVDLTRLVRVLKKANSTGRYWMGASDFEEGGKFRWFHNGTELDTANLDGMPDQDDKDQRCIQVGADGGSWLAHGCESPSKFVCEYSPEVDAAGGGGDGNGLSSSR